jgi:hypothetical protein
MDNPASCTTLNACSPMQCNAMQRNAVQCSAMQLNAMQLNAFSQRVQVLKKVAEERPPSLGKWSDRPQAPDATHTVTRDTEYKLLSDPDQVVDKEQRVKAYQVAAGAPVPCAPLFLGLCSATVAAPLLSADGRRPFRRTRMLSLDWGAVLQQHGTQSRHLAMSPVVDDIRSANGVVKDMRCLVVAAQYGSQTVPITDDLERLLAFKPAKGMQLLGFVTNDPAAPLVPRHTFMSVRC